MKTPIAEPEKRPDGRIVTFYSYKGGTGRSMAMANVSWILALSGLKVLVIDWDLEAPGLHRYFRPFLDDPDLAESDGLIDFVVHFAEAASEQNGEEAEADWFKPYSNLLPYAKELNYDFPGDGTLDFIPAGRQNGAYAVRVNSFNWKHFYEKLNGGQVLEEARRILREEYDYVLIDSRTGVSDTAGICTMQMPDDLVVAFTLNLQSVTGASAAAASVIEQRQAKKQPIRVFPVPMRVEPAEKLKTETMKAFAKPKFVPLLPDEMTGEQKDKYWAESDVPYIPFYAFEENLAYFRDEPNSQTSVLFAMMRIASRLTPGPVLELPKLDAELQSATIAAYDAFSGKGPVTAEPRPNRNVAVYLSVDGESNARGLRAELESGMFDLLPLERFEKARSAVFLLAIGAPGLTSRQSEDLAIAEHAQCGPIYVVLLPGAHPESLPRLLLPYEVIDLRAGARFALPDKSGGERLAHLPLAPYPGLNPFNATDGPLFIARGPLVEKLLEAVMRTNLVAVIGPPNSGRTSLVQAGLIPRLKGRQVIVVDANTATAPVTPPVEGTCLVLIAESAEPLAFYEQRLGITAERVEVPPLSEAGLMAAITEPAVHAGLHVDEDLQARIVADLKSEKAQLPLLQYTMSELFAAEPRGVLTLEKYARLGGAAMVEQQCESIYRGSGLGLLSRLAGFEKPGGLAAIPAPEASMSGARDRAVTEAFLNAGILIRDGNTIRFSNRIFLDRWPRLRQWVEANRDFLLWRQRLDQSLSLWQANPRDFTRLSGEALREAQKWAADRAEDLNEVELDYIRESVLNAQQRLAQQPAPRQRGRSRFAWIASAVVAVLIIAGTVLIRIGRQVAAVPPGDSGSHAIEKNVSANPPPQPAAPVEVKDKQKYQIFPVTGWCYQEAGSTGFGAYCHQSQQNCEVTAAGSKTASQCVLVEPLDLGTWGGVKPTPGGYRNSWYRKDLPEPLASPFPQPARPKFSQ